jgi:hypothetical protein
MVVDKMRLFSEMRKRRGINPTGYRTAPDQSGLMSAQLSPVDGALLDSRGIMEVKNLIRQWPSFPRRWESSLPGAGFLPSWE